MLSSVQFLLMMIGEQQLMKELAFDQVWLVASYYARLYTLQSHLPKLALSHSLYTQSRMFESEAPAEALQAVVNVYFPCCHAPTNRVENASRKRVAQTRYGFPFLLKLFILRRKKLHIYFFIFFNVQRSWLWNKQTKCIEICLTPLQAFVFEEYEKIKIYKIFTGWFCWWIVKNCPSVQSPFLISIHSRLPFNLKMICMFQLWIKPTNFLLEILQLNYLGN